MSRGRGWCVAAAVLLAASACTPAPEPQPAPTTPSATPSLSEQVEEVFTSASGVFQGYGDVRALLVVMDGDTVLERYAASTPQSTHDVYSVTKSVMSLLIGIALEEGHLTSVDQTLGELLPAYVPVMDPAVEAATLRQVLTMTAGLRVGDPIITETTDLVAETVADSYPAPAGGPFSYSNYGSHLLSAILVEATGVPTLDYAREHLFEPLGIASDPAAEPLAIEANQAVYDEAAFAWPVDPQGRHLGYAHLKLTPQDMLALGQLMLDGGSAGGRQIVPADWVSEATRPLVDLGDGVGYGYQWWATAADGHDAFAAAGFGGQLIEVVPDLDLVVVAATAVPENPAMDAGPLIGLVDEVIAPALAP